MKRKIRTIGDQQDEVKNLVADFIIWEKPDRVTRKAILRFQKWAMTRLCVTRL